MYYMRNPSCVLTSVGEDLVCVDGRSVLNVSGVDAVAVRAAIEDMHVPMVRTELEQRIDALLVESLVESGLLIHGNDADELRGAAARSLPTAPPILGHLVIALTGAVESSNMMPVLAQLRNACRQLDVILTAGAMRFLARDALVARRYRVWCDMWPDVPGAPSPHIDLGERAEVVVVMPASAGAIHRLAAGSCSDLMSLLVAATRAPVIVAPSMNEVMWRNPAIRRNVAQLRIDGLYIIEPTYALEVSGEPRQMHGGVGANAAGVLMTALAALAREQARGAKS